MSAKLTVESKRRDFFLVDPADVVVDQKLRGRLEIPSQEDVEKLAASILEHGQLQPCAARKMPDGTLKLVFGYTRHEAVTWLRKQGHDTKLQVTVSTMNDQEAAVRNIVENKERNATTPIDDAYNQRRLRDEFGYSTAEIAAIYKVTPAWISQQEKLLQLPNEVQKLISQGSLAASAALHMLELTAEEQQKLLAEAKKDSGKFDGAVIKAAVREKVVAAVEAEQAAAEAAGTDTDTADAALAATTTTIATAPKKGKKKKGKKDEPKKHHRSAKELREFWSSLTGPGEDEAISQFAKTTMLFMAGQRSEDTMEKAVNALLDAKRSKK